MNQDLLELLTLCVLATKQAPMRVDVQRAVHDGLTIITYEEVNPGFLEANRLMYDDCKNTLKAIK